MRITAVTRNSSLSALLLLITIIVASLLRHDARPFATELSAGAGLTPWGMAIAAIAILATAFIANRTASSTGIFKEYCTLPLPLYGLVACGIFITADLPIVAITALCVAMSLLLLTRNLTAAADKDSVFFGSMLLGVTALLYPPCIVLVVAIPLSIVLFTLSFRQVVIAIAGWLLPPLMALYAAWYGDTVDEFVAQYEALLVERPMTTIPWGAIAIAAAILVILLGGIFASTAARRQFMIIRTRRATQFFTLMFIGATLPIALPSHPIAMLTIVAVPASLVISMALARMSNTAGAILYWLLLAATLAHLFVE